MDFAMDMYSNMRTNLSVLTPQNGRELGMTGQPRQIILKRKIWLTSLFQSPLTGLCL